MKIVCSISTACRIIFWMILAGFVLAIVVTGGDRGHGTGDTGVPPVPSAAVTHCHVAEEVNDPCSRT